jgi:hypothetical protein
MKIRIAVGAIILGVLGVGGALFYVSRTWVTEDELQRELARELPEGSTQQQIFAFLDSKGADYGEPGTAEPYLYLEQRGVPPETLVIAAILRNTGWALFGRAHLKLYFILDNEGKLQQVYVDEVYDGV